MSYAAAPGRIEVVRLAAGDLAAYRALRMRGLRENPHAFGETTERFAARSDEDIRQRLSKRPEDGDFVLAARDEAGALVGTVRLVRSEGERARHRGQLVGMYVTPEASGRKVGRALVTELLRRAEGVPGLEQVHLAVVTTNSRAIALYEGTGFRTYGTDPRALMVEGVFLDEYLMVKYLR